MQKKKQSPPTVTFRALGADEVPQMRALILARVAWMDEVGIHQWNDTDYDGVYPLAYYEECFARGELYGLFDGDGVMLAVAALKERDERWEQDGKAAFYVHHLASRIGARGAGSQCLLAIEDHARATGKTHVRLDSAVDNATLTAYYEARGYRPVGHCIDGAYTGILREKKL